MEDAKESKSAFVPSCLFVFFLALTYLHIPDMAIEFGAIAKRQSLATILKIFRNFVGLHGRGFECAHLGNCSGEFLPVYFVRLPCRPCDVERVLEEAVDMVSDDYN